MINLNFEFPASGRILCLGAHCDDIEIGCCGALLKLLQTARSHQVCWVVFSKTPTREREAVNSANYFLQNADEKSILIKDFRDGFFPYCGAEIKEFFEKLKREFSPDVIFTHYRDDLHQDHRTISELTWNTFRNHMILEYEIPKYDGDLGSPNFYVALNEEIARKKIAAIVKHFPSQKENHWFSEENFLSILRVRGIEANTQLAEAFHCRKMIY